MNTNNFSLQDWVYWTYRYGALEPAAPSITLQPQSQTVTAGSPVYFYASGPDIQGTYTYQWQKGTTDIPGATSQTYGFIPVIGDNATTYRVVISSGTGSPVTSSSATLTVVAAPAGVPVNTGVPVVTGSAVVNSTLSATNGTWSGSPSSYRYQWMRDGASINGATTSTYVLTGADRGFTMSVRVYAYNAAGGSVTGAFSIPTLPVADGEPAPEPIVTFTNAVQGQWVRENIVQNCVDRETAGDYYVIGTATGGGAFQLRKRLPNGTLGTAVTIATNEADDHNIPAPVQLLSGRWMTAFARHGLTTTIRYAVGATPHELDFGTIRTLATSDICTYSQLYVVGNRVVLMYRVGSSADGAWMCRYCDNIGAAIDDHTWSAEIPITPTTYMDSCRDGDTLRCAVYDHPVSGATHHMWAFDIDLVSGDMTTTATGSAVVGNIYTNTNPVANSAVRQVVTISSGTSRMFSLDVDGNIYGMEMASATVAGTYYRYVRVAGTGVYTKQAVSTTGLPFLGGAQGYYGSICRLDANRVLCSVNVGASIGVGAWELREYVTSNGGTSWTLVDTYESSAIILRPQVINNIKFWFEANPYASYTSFTANGKMQTSTTAVFTPRPSVPAGTDPAPGVPLSIAGAPGSAIENVDYNFTPTITGGTPPYAVTLTAGTLPAGLSLNGSTGVISGTPTTAGTASGLELTVTDDASGSDTLGPFSITVAEAGDFAPAGAVTLTQITDIGNNQYQATTSAGSQGGILWTGQKSVENGEFAVRSGFNHAGASCIIGMGATSLPTSSSTAQLIALQTTAAGQIQYSLSGASAVVLSPNAFATRSPNNILELYREAAGGCYARWSTDNGATWSTPSLLLTTTAEVFFRYYCSYSGSAVPPARVIDNPTVSGVVSV